LNRPQPSFIYKADSGLFNTMADIGHKICASDTCECALGALTHGYPTERTARHDMVESLSNKRVFLHRDEFTRRYPSRQIRLPAIFILRDDQSRCCAGADATAGCTDLAALQNPIHQRCRP